MASQRGRNSNRNSIDNFLDDLLGSDTEDANKKKTSSKNVDKRKKEGKEVKLTSSSSDAEFYRNLKSLGGGKIESDISEDEELSDHALQKVADDIDDLDDLDSNLFAGLSGGSGLKKERMESTGSKQNRVQKKHPPKYDLDDPLAGLGLSDDEELQPDVSKKVTPPKRSLSHRLSGEKMRVEPSPDTTSDNDVHKSPNTDTGKDPFITSNTRRKLSRTVSVDEPSANESDISPRSSQEKLRKKSRRKNSVDPTVKHNDNEGDMTELSRASEHNRSNPIKKPPVKKVENDLFDDSDDLPGFSDDDETPKKKIVPKKEVDYDDIPAEKASAALTNLLGGSKESPRKKSSEPTLLDQIMSGKKVEKKVDDEDLQFGGYSPSVVSSRPTTAPTSRSVRFADDLGLDLDDNGERPASAPTRKTNKQNKDINPNTLPHSPHSNENMDSSGSERISKRDSSPITTAKNKGKKASDDDWLGLGDDLTDQLILNSSGDLKASNGINNKSAKKTDEVKNLDINSNKAEGDGLKLPWESNEKKTKFGRRSSLPPKEATSNEFISDKNNNNVTLSEPNLVTQPVKNTMLMEETDENNFLNLIKKKKVEKSKLDTVSQLTTQPSVASKIITSSPIASTSSAPNPPVVLHNAVYNAPFTQDLQPNLHQKDETVVHQPPSSMQVLPDMKSLQVFTESLQRDFQQQQQEEFNATKRQFERDKSYLESELHDLQQKVLKLEEVKSASASDHTSKIRELESSIRKLELERDQLLFSIESNKKRHKDELKALEDSHKNRMGFLESSYKRREDQLKDEVDMMKVYSDERIKTLNEEKDDLLSGFRKKTEQLERNRVTELDRLKELHKKALNDLVKEHADQIDHLRTMKEQEVAAAVNAVSHTKSLQSLITEVHNSTRQVSNLQTKLDASHQSKLLDREQALKARDEYLKNLEQRVQQQETQNEAERHRLQGLVSKLEIQLREQTRQIEQDKWKLNQDDNRLKTMQASFDEERRITTEQLQQDRQQLSKAREDMLAEQRRIIAECYEEKRKVHQERTQLTSLQTEVIAQSRNDRTSAVQAESDLEATMVRYQHESSQFSVRLVQMKQQEEKLIKDKQELANEQKCLREEFERLRKAGKEVQERSVEVEKFATEAKRLHEEGVGALEEAQTIKSQHMDILNQLEIKSLSLEAQEKSLKKEKGNIESERRQLEEDKTQNFCPSCKQINMSIPTEPFIRSIPLVNNTQSTVHPTHSLISPFHGKQATPMQHKHAQSFPNHIRYTSSPKKALSNAQGVDTQHGIFAISPHPHSNNADSYPNIMTDFSQDSLQQTRSHQNTTYDVMYPPPDLIMNNFEYKRALRRWSTAKEKDDDFFESEERYLKSLQQKRDR